MLEGDQAADDLYAHFKVKSADDLAETDWREFIRLAKLSCEDRAEVVDSKRRAPSGPHDLRLRLLKNGFAPLPAAGKAIYLKGWQAANITPEAIASWECGKHQSDRNTGIRTKDTPAFDIDIKEQTAAEAVEAMVRERFGGRGRVLLRIGKAPKRAVLFRTGSPFTKIARSLIAPDGSAGQKLEFLGDGQQIVAHGIHPDTKQAYIWHGGTPWEVPASALPLITEAEAHALVDDAAALLVERFGYRPAKAESGTAAEGTTNIDARELIDRILDGVNLHDSVRDLAWELIRTGTDKQMAVLMIRGLLSKSDAVCDTDRWQARYDDVSRAVESAVKKLARADAASQFEPVEIGDDAKATGWPVADLWAKDDDDTPPELPAGVIPDYVDRFAHDQSRRLGVAPGAIAAAAITVLGGLFSAQNQLQMRQRDPGWKVRCILWCGLIAPPASKKSPLLNSVKVPLQRVEQELAKRYAAGMAAKEAREAFAKGQANKLRSADDLFAEPKQQRKMVMVASTEKLAELAAENPWGLLCVRDELSGLIAEMDAYTARTGKDRAFFLEAKEGNPWVVDRKTSGSSYADICAVSLIGGIQNRKIAELARKMDLASDGFLQRFMPIYLVSERGRTDIAADADLDRVTEAIGPKIAFAPPSEEPFRFAPEADAELQAVEDFAETEAGQPDAPGALQEWVGKLPGEFGRIALAFHVITWAEAGDSDRPPPLISQATAHRARRFILEFVYGHARCFYRALAGARTSEDARSIAALLLVRWAGETEIGVRDLQRHGPSRLRKASNLPRVQAAMHELDMLGWVKPANGQPLGAMPARWLINPAVHDGRFADRAETERGRRAKAKFYG